MTVNTTDGLHHDEAAAPTPDRAEHGRRRLPGTAFVGRFFWLWPALLMLALGVRGAQRPQLWRDELATWSAAARSTGELLDMLRHVDAVSGSYYLLMHGWISLFGDSPAVLRLPSALAMTGAAVFVTLAARKLFDTRTAVVAGLLFAVIPSMSRYAQEVRSYAFAVLAVSAATWLLLRALERPTVLRWLPYSVAVAFAGLFHMVALAVLIGHLVVVAMRRPRRERKLLIGFPAAVAVGLLPVLPVVVLGRQQVGRQISWLTTPGLSSFGSLWTGLFGSVLVAVCIAALAGMPAAWPAGRRRAFEIGVIGVLPIIAVWVISQGKTSYFLDRYELFAVPALAVLAAAGLAALRPRALTAVGLAVVAGLGVPDQQNLRTSTAHEWSNEKAAARIVATGYRPGDGIVPVRGSSEYMMLAFALDYYLPDSVRPKDVFVARTPVENDDLYSTPCADPAACLTGVDRIWVVTYGSVDDPFKDLPEAETRALSAQYRKSTVQHVQGLTVTLMERPHPS
ncbi:glycosyltransferase family 39 protein [Kitasatospora sp. NPDC088134]|uniref:glycosyltransferase family 39 protein n=1 Tax=Kitasatospora sp. NPDC088134 TaxID=3364071 RepID=UPI0038130C41